MATELPGSLKAKYSVLQNEFGTKEFSHEEAIRILRKEGDDGTPATALSKLKEAENLKSSVLDSI